MYIVTSLTNLFVMHKTFNQLISLLIILILLLPVATRVWIIVDFSVRQNYIAKVRCVNKAAPESTCNGKCYLKKQLKQTGEDRHNKATTILKENILSNFLLPIVNLQDKQQHLTVHITSFRFYPPFKKSFFINKLFRPPQNI